MSIVSRSLLVFSVLFVLLHAWAAFLPSYANWGFHFLAFYPSGVLLVFTVLSVLFFIPAFQGRILLILKTVLRSLKALPTPLHLILICGILIGTTMFAGAKLHLLGDGALLLRSIVAPFTLSHFPPSFANQPFLFPFFWFVYQVTNLFTNSSTELVYLTLDILSGLSFVLLLLWYSSKQAGTTTDKFLLGSIVFLGAGSQFFFGYIENYAVPYTLTLAYLVTAILTIEKKLSILIPLLFFFLMVSVNLGLVVLAPSLAILFAQTWNGKRITAILILCGAAIIGFIGLYAIGFKIDKFILHFIQGSPDFLPFGARQKDYYPYSLFSFDHLIDWFNANLLIAPFSLFIILLVSFVGRKHLYTKENAGVFLVVATACGLFFTWIINASLGMPRDWDMLSSYFVPVLFFSAFSLKYVIDMPGVRNAIIMIFGLILLHWVSWIGVNAQSDRHFARIEVLRTSSYLSLSSRLAFYDALSTYAYEQKDYELARKYYSLYLEINELNPRILANISDIYRKLNMEEEYFAILKKAADRGTPEPVIYSNLGVEYMKRGDTSKSLSMNLKALSFNPFIKETQANVGLVYYKLKQYDSAYVHISKAVSLGMKDQNIFMLAARSAFMLNDYPTALKYCDIYLSIVPGDKDMVALRDRLVMKKQE